MSGIARANHDFAQRLINGDPVAVLQVAVEGLDAAYHQERNAHTRTQAELQLTQGVLVVSVTALDRARQIVDLVDTRARVTEAALQITQLQLHGTQQANGHLQTDLQNTRNELRRLEGTCPVRAMNRVTRLKNSVSNFLHANRVNIIMGFVAVSVVASKCFPQNT